MGVGAFLKKALPFLSTAAGLAVPGAAPIISAATKIVGAKLNKVIEPSADSLSEALSEAFGDPAQHAQLLEAEQEFQKAMQAMGYQQVKDMETLANADRASARAREESVKDRTPAHLAWTIVACAMLLCGFLVSHKSTILDNATMAGFAGTVLGYIMGDMKQVVNYYFGSTTESATNGNGKH